MSNTNNKLTAAQNLERFNLISARVNAANQKLVEYRTRVSMTKEEEQRIAEEVKELGFGDGTYEGLVSFVRTENEKLTTALDEIEDILNKIEPLLQIESGV